MKIVAKLKIIAVVLAAFAGTSASHAGVSDYPGTVAVWTGSGEYGWMNYGATLPPQSTVTLMLSASNDVGSGANVYSKMTAWVGPGGSIPLDHEVSFYGTTGSDSEVVYYYPYDGVVTVDINLYRTNHASLYAEGIVMWY